MTPLFVSGNHKKKVRSGEQAFAVLSARAK